MTLSTALGFGVPSKEPVLEFFVKTETLTPATSLTTTENCSRIYFVRHGQSTANVQFEHEGEMVRYVSGQSSEVPLTPKGEKQIAELAQKIAQNFPKNAPLTIINSCAERTKQTAEILFKKLSETHDVTLVKEGYPGLNERGLGNWEGKIRDQTYHDAEKPWKSLPAKEKFISREVPGAETYKEVADRALEAISEIYSKYPESTVFAVTSFHTINALTMRANGWVDRFSRNEKELPITKLDNGDMMLLEISKGEGFPSAQVKTHIKREG